MASLNTNENVVQSRRRPMILVTNDDGIYSPGIRALAQAMDELGDVVVIAPISEQSAVGHSITLTNPIRVNDYSLGSELSHIRALGISGTPSDCMKLALHELSHRKPDLTVSGINRGSNVAINVIYSGTISAATESSVNGIDSIAFSLDSKDINADYSAASTYAKIIAGKVLRSRLPRGIVLSANIPDLPEDKIKGIRVTRQAISRWEEDFIARTDPSNKPYYWYRGMLQVSDEATDTDAKVMEEGYVSITPLQCDRTAHGCIDVFKTWRWPDSADQIL